MSAELDKLASELKVRGYTKAGQMLSDMNLVLSQAGFMPERLETRADQNANSLSLLDEVQGLPFNERLGKYLQTLGMSQTHLAEAINMSPEHLNRIIKGKRKQPPIKKVILMGQVLRLSANDQRELIKSAGYNEATLTFYTEPDN
jgi:DNA-binding XRE family transcriptional regulator